MLKTALDALATLAIWFLIIMSACSAAAPILQALQGHTSIKVARCVPVTEATCVWTPEK